MDQYITRDDAIARFAAFVDQQIAAGKQGTRHVEFSIDAKQRITSLRATALPPKLERLPPVNIAASPREKNLNATTEKNLASRVADNRSQL